MKTTVEVPDSLYRQIKARAALKGQTIKAFFIDAIRDKLISEKSEPDNQTGWRAVFGAADPKDMAELQRVIDEEFSKIDPETWK